ncbi:hypothetical protein TVAG_195840 [Trichomonas vaginalis G3]|uniref:DUF3447 domain-containing protein n=1 Tax=Trichomonas vaginalis (strain ATCC PRA-98 / G3) TaxID=412133 RepID=A2ETM3_TRIV3|nr:protein of unknown function (DUF3447) [Trichomonas vaginalis G3]EAY03991.1 hypothetical protein TVAG_195840 [Trichomonas vaginalis G3]KAI5534905.1 protein of unknown function (DUF3447) [Trichomonas vaginalis G3]|eukprot:XP_001316214.1 hypothetical protein [Trichomonas vaginalis G3]
MSDQDIHPNKYSELHSIYKCYIDSYIMLYQLKTEKEEELNSIYKMIKTVLIDSMKFLPQDIIKDILDIIPFNNRYTKSYLSLAKLISDEYHVKEVKKIPTISNYLFYKEYGIKLDKSDDFKIIESENFDIFTKNTIYRAIMYNDKESFIFLIESEGFNEDQTLKSEMYPFPYKKAYSLLELCCYYGAVDCFKLLRTKCNLKITYQCLFLSFLGRNPEIMNECLKYQEPNPICMMCAIISHNIDFVTFLVNEYKIMIDLNQCILYNNLESFLVYFDQTNDINQCFLYSINFDIPSLCEYFLSHGANINYLRYAAGCNSKETIKLLISHGSNINEKDKAGKTALHYAAESNSKESAEILISYDTNINDRDKYGKPLFMLQHKIIVKKQPNFLFHMAQISMKKIIMEKPLFILQQNIILKKQPNFLFHMAQISMKKIIMEKPLFFMQQEKIGKKLSNFLFHMVQISMKKIIMEKLLFTLQQKVIVKNQPKFLFHMVQISMIEINMGKPLFMLQHKIIVKKQPNFLFHMAQI